MAESLVTDMLPCVLNSTGLYSGTVFSLNCVHLQCNLGFPKGSILLYNIVYCFEPWAISYSYWIVEPCTGLLIIVSKYEYIVQYWTAYICQCTIMTVLNIVCSSQIQNEQTKLRNYTNEIWNNSTWNQKYLPNKRYSAKPTGKTFLGRQCNRWIKGTSSEAKADLVIIIS